MNSSVGHLAEDVQNSTGKPGHMYSIQYFDITPHSHRPPLWVPYMGNTIWHTGNYWERRNSAIFGIEFVTNGNARFIQNGKEYRVAKNEVFLLQKGSTHRYETGSSNQLHKRFMMIEGPLLDLLLRQTALAFCDHIIPRKPNKIARLMKSAYKTFKKRAYDFVESTSAKAYELLVELAASIQKPVYPQSVSTALRYVDREIPRPITNSELARHVGLSVSHFNRLFRNALGMSPGRFVLRKRMSYAATHLLASNTSVKALAFELGYENQFVFSYQFKKWAGVPPRQYRRSKIGS